MSEVTFTANRWVCGDAVLELECILTAFVSEIQVTLSDALTPEGRPIKYWQRAALIDWVACHQQTLRAALHADEERDGQWLLPVGWNGLEPSGWTEVTS